MHYAATKCNYLQQAIFKTCVPRTINSLEDFANVAFYEVPAMENWRRQMKVRVLNRSGQLLGHTSEQRVAASTLRRYSGLRLAIVQADARPVMPVSFS